MVEVKRDKFGRPRVYLEEDCPVEELSVESQRERGASSALPPLYFLHVWWARRPLTTSRAAVIGSLLPAGYNRKEFLELIGIPRDKDPIGARKRIDEVKTGIRKERVKDPYGYPRAFTHSLNNKQKESLQNATANIWNGDIKVLDSFAGGGSIPFESVRMGFDTISNELNPVASVIQRATIEYPKVFGEGLITDIERIKKDLEKKIVQELSPYFPRNPGEEDLCYIWVRTVKCSRCGLHIPLAPNWWLDTSNELAYRLQLPSEPYDNHCSFKIAKPSDDFSPDEGTIKRGIATCPNCSNVMEAKEVKQEAQEDRMGQQLAVIGYKTKGRSGRFFREVNEADLKGVELAEKALNESFPKWDNRGLIPQETILKGKETARVHQYGIHKWHQMFNSRQLLVHLTTLEMILDYPWMEIEDDKKSEALRVYFQMVFDKCLVYDSNQSRLHSSRLVMVSAFERHDFAFKWSTAEIDGAGNLFRFGCNQIIDSYKGLCSLISRSDGEITFNNGDASDLDQIESNSINLVAIDPPYYDNVMYSECSDFFYVWMKRSLGDVFPELFSAELTDKEKEAVANPARFKGSGSSATKLAALDYEAKMKASFTELNRVLKDDGVMNIMFTHKKVEAWDTLAKAIVDAGFMITAAWPIHTESEHSLHQAKKNAAASTILLVCRKRPTSGDTVWWEDLKHTLDERVKEKAEKFEKMGLRGQDTFIACFGPALEVISENWPVKTMDDEVIRPDQALDRARSIVSQWFMDNIAEGKAEDLDKVTRFYILSWFLFKAREFPYDEARKLSFSLDVDIDELVKRNILKKKGDYVILQKPSDRSRSRAFNDNVREFDFTIDLVQAAMLAYETGKSTELARFHQRTNALNQRGYKETIEYLLDILPRTKEVVEYTILNEMWESNYRDSIKRKVRSTENVGMTQSRLDLSEDEDEKDEDL